MDGPRSGLSGSLTGSQFGGEVFDWFTVLEVSLYYLWHVLLYDTEVPGATGVDDQVRAVFTVAEAVYGVHAYVPIDTLRA